MKKHIITLVLAMGISIFAFSQKYYGEKINATGAIAVSELPKMLEGKNSINTKIEGKIESVCQVKGCWMQLDMGNGKKVRVTFKDYAFFMPKKSAGKTAILEGVASKEITDIATLKHYAEDAGKSKEEIAKITQAKEEIVFEAKGVIIK
ncbi:MAG: DUF4920 domain-containing protein [Thermonemataceae bacterium]|nr:DUF4920 domain-containing protein [Thermonemataceae bacterium]